MQAITKLTADDSTNIMNYRKCDEVETALANLIKIGRRHKSGIMSALLNSKPGLDDSSLE